MPDQTAEETPEVEQEQPQQQVDPNTLPENRPQGQDVIDTLVEELQQVEARFNAMNQERLFFKAQSKKFKRERDEALAQVAEFEEIHKVTPLANREARRRAAKQAPKKTEPKTPAG